LNPARQFSSSKQLIRKKTAELPDEADGRVDVDANCRGESSN